MSLGYEYIKYDSKNNIIVLKTIAKATAEAMKHAFTQILEMSEIENCKNVLIDATKTIELPSIWKLHKVGTFMSKQALKLFKLRVAMTIPDEMSTEYRFFDNVLINRMVDFHIFTNLDDAKDWLLSK